MAHIYKHNTVLLKHNKAVVETQHSIIQAQHNIIETQHNVTSKHNSVFAKNNANLPKHNTIFAKHNSRCSLLRNAGCYYTKHCYTKHYSTHHFVCCVHTWQYVARMDVFFKCFNCLEETERRFSFIIIFSVGLITRLYYSF